MDFYHADKRSHLTGSKRRRAGAGGYDCPMSLTDHRRSESNSPPSRVGSLTSGLAGGAVAVFLSFLPLSEVLGGGVAGYLDRGAGRRGTTAGVVAGLVGSLPYLVVGVSLAASPGIALPGPELALSREAVLAGATGVAVVFAVGLSVLGSLIGGSLRDER